ncbi:hypothetical protein HOL21_04410 [Candidatus Woesearchaeota archaeon]|jgi:hypothetical protein|nr:hypothetical protein [Candidatus Woesearchaeota archaeon]MBT5397430.1 hypothetical protein [Candidatus Woesearchaeota archaeon]MBT5924958.1 hypothetical protein [Candidatus Woesearchaeota archaeon]MBT6367064.1 hypothetical protein [Candidatus Woesearchaeota archaeon]MBT7762830.1 hypothetical protein [Candidatus Woesearchaeota archaeon]
MFSKKGQGLSLNVIIVAAIALIVLVVLVVIFTAKSADFERGVSKEGQTEIAKIRISYGDCQPTGLSEQNFLRAYGSAETPEEQQEAITDLETRVADCKANDQTSCLIAGCKWS